MGAYGNGSNLLWNFNSEKAAGKGLLISSFFNVPPSASLFFKYGLNGDPGF